MNKRQASHILAGKELTLETGELARFATSSVLARLGDTMVLVTVVEGNERPDMDYFPLSVEYMERLYAGGRIKGSRWVKREGRPSDDAILTGRLIDRSIRPLFPKAYKKEVQITITVLSVDGENEPDTLSIIAVSAALARSPIPWAGPVSAVRVGYVKEKDKDTGEFIVNPGPVNEFLELDLVVTQSKEKTLMIEAGAMELKEELVLSAIEKAQEENAKLIDFITEFAKEGMPKSDAPDNPLFYELIKKIEKSYKDEVAALLPGRVQKESSNDTSTDSLISRILEDELVQDPKTKVDKKLIAKAIEYVLYQIIRANVLKGNRPDGRKVDEIRQIDSRVSVLPRTHGSAIFQRGDTQALSVATLGSPRMEQLIESAEGEESKRYMHHYSFPPYSVGETGRMGTPSRREIGHGALAERALSAVIPTQENFPYTIRVVSEILASNGSTSMASTCGSTLALMDAGVPIKSPVAGVAMGMMSTPAGSDKTGEYVILTDILGLEDFSGDMDFKVAGTKDGITAIQLDVKTAGLTLSQIKETFEKAKVGREFILEKMLAALPTSRTEVSTYAPKIELIHIPVEKIGEVIGPGGRMIKSIIAQTGATVDVEDDGTVTVSGTSEESVRMATDWVKGLTREIKVGENFEGEVKRILPFGAFVELIPGKDGMVHVSHMSEDFVKNPEDVVQIGDMVKVKVTEVDEQGRINLTMRLDADGNEIKRERRDSGSSDRPRHEARGGPNDRATDRAPERREHPLSMQFKREREEKFVPGGNRPRGPRNYKKPRY